MLRAILLGSSAASARAVSAPRLRISATLAAALLCLPGIAAAQTTLTARQQVQHALRRFTFGEPPEVVTAVTTSGLQAWLTQQLNPSSIDDTGSTLETLPTGPTNDGQIWERTLLQHWILTNRQVQAKLELHWLEHFSISINTIGYPELMDHYVQTVRANALGNFETLLNAVAHEPAMLRWLSNDGNVPPKPNENFGRELMQLYSIGEFKRNPDGSQVMNTDGTPATNYGENDVKSAALGMTGYSVTFNNNDTNPQTRWGVAFNPHNAATRNVTVAGKLVKTLGAADPMALVVAAVAQNPQTAIYESRELLLRFASENPSPQYISDIAAVWTANLKAPDQIARVITAIINHPEFNKSYRSMQKQPVEVVIGALRVLAGSLQKAGNNGPGGSLPYWLSTLSQEPYTPPSVFSFYTPGNLEAIINSRTILNRSGVTASLTSGTAANNDTTLDLSGLLTRIGSTKGSVISAYLLDALVDGGSTGLQSTITTYIGGKPTPQRVQGALWLLLNSPEYGVN